MSSQSSPSLPVRRAAAAFGATAVLCLSMAAPALAVPLPDPSPLQQVPSLTGSASSADQSTYQGEGSVSRLGPPDNGVGREVTPQSGSGAGSASSAEGSTPAVTAPSPSSLSLPSVDTSDLPAIGAGVVVAVLVGGSLVMLSSNRRRPA